MKNSLFILMTLMPILALGQDKIFESHYLPKENDFAQHLLLTASNHLEKNLEVTLIDDRRYDQPVPSFDLNKSFSLSFTAKKTEDSRLNNDEKVLQVEPLLDLKWMFRKSFDRENYFEN